MPNAWLSPYVDPVALCVICLVIIPVSLRTILAAQSDICLVTPRDLEDQVEGGASEIVERYGFVSYRTCVARVGRGRQIELNFIVARNEPAQRLEHGDTLRDHIGEILDCKNPDVWLTIVFTTDPEWAL